MYDDRLDGLSELQLEILRILWKRGESSAAEVREALEPERAFAASTVATMLTRLERRGVVRRHQEGRRVTFEADVEEQDVRSSMVTDLMSRLFGGDAQALVSHLLESGEIDADELDQLRAEVRRIRRKRKGGGK